jgi:spermidine synthase
LIYRNIKTSKTPITDDLKAESALCPPKKQRQVIFDRNTITFEVYQAMLAGLSLSDLGSRKLKVLVCGTGVGVFTMFLKHHLHSALEKIVTVDINEEFVKLGEKYFGFSPQDPLIDSVICDAHQYVQRMVIEKVKFDLIFMDVCYDTASDEGVSPPIHFLDQSFIASLTDILSEGGVCAINTIIKSE